MKPGLKRYKSKEELLRPQVKSLAAVRSVSASLQCRGFGLGMLHRVLEPKTKVAEGVFFYPVRWLRRAQTKKNHHVQAGCEMKVLFTSTYILSRLLHILAALLSFSSGRPTFRSHLV